MSHRLFYRLDTGETTRCASGDSQEPVEGEGFVLVAEMIAPSRVKVDLATLTLVDADQPVVPLDVLKRAASRAVDDAAEVVRLRFITGGAGQALEYQQTEWEARAWRFDEELDNFPFLKAEVDALAEATGQPPDPAAVVATILAQAEAWQSVGAEIKRLRRAAKLAIEAATTPEQIEQAKNIAWPAPS